MFVLPAATVNWSYGSATTQVVPLRKHQRSRWPMTNPGNGALEAPASDFSEAPTSYLVYITADGPPSLKIQSWTGNQVRISWATTATAAGYSLQRSTAINSGYSSPGLGLATEGADSVSYDTIASSPRFYRLVK